MSPSSPTRSPSSQRTSLGVAAAPATERFGIGASVLSSFAVLQLVTYAARQIPVGILVDRFGSRGWSRRAPC